LSSALEGRVAHVGGAGLSGGGARVHHVLQTANSPDEVPLHCLPPAGLPQGMNLNALVGKMLVACPAVCSGQEVGPIHRPSLKQEGIRMDLHYAPGACSQGIHLLLEEVGAPFTLKRVDMASKAQYGEAYLKINPKSKVPALAIDDDTVLTEFPAIAFYLAKTFPDAKLLPADTLSQVRAMELLEYITATVHMRGYTRIFRPEAFGTDLDAVKKEGYAIVNLGLRLLDERLGDKDYLLGDFSIADAGLFFIEWWYRVRLKSALPPNLTRHYATMLGRPSVQRMMASEGASA